MFNFKSDRPMGDYCYLFSHLFKSLQSNISDNLKVGMVISPIFCALSITKSSVFVASYFKPSSKPVRYLSLSSHFLCQSPGPHQSVAVLLKCSLWAAKHPLPCSWSSTLLLAQVLILLPHRPQAS